MYRLRVVFDTSNLYRSERRRKGKCFGKLIEELLECKILSLLSRRTRVTDTTVFAATIVVVVVVVDRPTAAR
jgi:hypothetical protein